MSSAIPDLTTLNPGMLPSTAVGGGGGGGSGGVIGPSTLVPVVSSSTKGMLVLSNFRLV